MKSYVLPCALSALAGALFASYATAPWGSADLAAGEPTATPAAQPHSPVSRLPQTSPHEEELSPEERINVNVYEAVNRSVVNINTKMVRTDVFSIFEIPSEGAGSGSVLDKLGHILTNYHVVAGAREIEVTLHDGKNYDARLVGKDEANDVAVLRIEAPAASLLPVVFGDSRFLKVGQRVLAIGNPFGLQRTLTVEIISSLDRSLPARNNRTIKSVIQIDAAINPGNSGGPLLDSHGRLIGMNTAIATSTGQSAGVGFAIPIANIARVVPELIEHGHVIRPDAGITRVLQTEEGLIIATLSSGGPAEKAGLQGFKIVRQKRKQGIFVYETQTIDRNSADMIIAINGKKVVTASDFLALVEAHHPGDEISITVMRAGKEVDVRLRLAAGES